MRTTVFLALLLSGCGGSSGKKCDLTGTWNTSIGQVVFNADGTYSVENGPSGAWQIDGNKLTITGGCNGAIGSYTTTFLQSCSIAELHVANDACTDRAMGIDGLVGTRAAGVGGATDMAGVDLAEAPPDLAGTHLTCTVTGTSCTCKEVAGAGDDSTTTCGDSDSFCCEDSDYPLTKLSQCYCEPKQIYGCSVSNGGADCDCAWDEGWTDKCVLTATGTKICCLDPSPVPNTWGYCYCNTYDTDCAMFTKVTSCDSPHVASQQSCNKGLTDPVGFCNP